MTKALRYCLAVLAAALLIPAQAFAENGKFYTRKALLEDFPAKMTKVVLSGSPMVDAVVKEEVNQRWNLSPYEFCTAEQYEANRQSSDYYFLHFVKMDDVIFLSLDKGGTKDDPDIRKQCFEVVSIPVSGADLQTMDNLEYMPAFIDIIQDFVGNAMNSESKAYSGLAQYNGSIGGKAIYIDKEEASRHFTEGTSNALSGLLVAAANPRLGSWCYRMLISCDTHELLYYKKHKVSTSVGAEWLKGEIKKFDGNSAQ